ncbi:alpha/beta hydrolase [Bacillus sp. NP157]|nr:alpha/beta hydrolase [Bacillus sp. NP157]
MRVPVVYVHGFIGHLRLDELKEGLDGEDVFRPDLAGYGVFASRGTSAMSIADQARHLAACIEADIGRIPAVIVGHSAGAAVVMRYAKAYPERVAAIVSAEGNLAPSDAFLSSRLAPMSSAEVVAWLDKARENPAGLVTSDGKRMTGVPLQRMTDWLHHQPASVIHAAARAVLAETLRPDYPADVQAIAARIPTFLIAGERTPEAMRMPPSLRELAAGTFVIRDTGHVMVLEAPGEVARCVSQVVAWVRDRAVQDGP